jgi:DMSO/TMAO reductase YedYZ molybdopterin-dependent catalytic subunit
MTRRDLLRAAPLAALPSFARAQDAQEPAATAGGMIVRMREPQNLETPAAGLAPWKTPTEQFFVRSHFAVPKLDPTNYTLTVTGHVENPLTLSFKELLNIPVVTKPLTLECAGNGRVFLVPQVRGLQWGIGAVGTAEWQGVPLAAVLERAKVKAGAAEVVLVGADKGAINVDPPSPGAIPFDRAIPIAKAKKDECVLATHMNGEPLTPAHGAPVRAVVGGWYGMASVKWLAKIVVVEKPYASFWQTMDYSVWDRSGGMPSLVPLTSIQPKAVITSHVENQVVRSNKEGYQLILGKAWAGENGVAKVEISTDGGTTWNLAVLVKDEKPFCWRSWLFTWRPQAPGPAKLVARCTDDKGNTQPDQRDPDRRSYMINHLVPVEVLVR